MVEAASCDFSSIDSSCPRKCKFPPTTRILRSSKATAACPLSAGLLWEGDGDDDDSLLIAIESEGSKRNAMRRAFFVNLECGVCTCSGSLRPYEVNGEDLWVVSFLEVLFAIME